MAIRGSRYTASLCVKLSCHIIRCRFSFVMLL
uniref:Uncharacterized protein n=1 Tax=Setaria italica TaxID=4555 RepID=K3Y231_SETIT